MEIDNHILSLSMEFERQNIIINEYETQKAKNAHDRAWQRKHRKLRQNSAKNAEKSESGGSRSQSARSSRENDEENRDFSQKGEGIDDEGWHTFNIFVKVLQITENLLQIPDSKNVFKRTERCCFSMRALEALHHGPIKWRFSCVPWFLNMVPKFAI